MSLFSQKIDVGSPDLSRFERVELMVDTGSTYTWLPQEVVKRLGLIPIGKRKIRFANGNLGDREMVEASIRINGETLHNLCLVAVKKDAFLLGSLTLEAFSLSVDPVNRRLVPVVASAMTLMEKKKC